MFGRLQINRCGCIQYIFWEKKKRDLVVGFVEKQRLLGVCLEPGMVALTRWGALGYKTAQDLNSRLILRCQLGLI